MPGSLSVARGGIVGAGRMGLTHFAILNTRDDIDMVAITDPSPLIRRNAGRLLSVDAFSDYHEMIDRKALDFVVVACPTEFHLEAARYAIDHDLHVFVEKPFTVDSRQGASALEAMRGKDLVNQVGYVLRFNDVFSRVRRHLRDAVLTDLIGFRIEVRGPTVLRVSRKSWRSKTRSGGGCLRDFASHAIDLVNYLFGPPDEISGSVLQKIYSPDVPDAVLSTFRYEPTGVIGSLYANWSDSAYRKPAYHLEVLGRNGKILADQHGYKVFLRESRTDLGLSAGWNTRYLTDFVEPVRFYVRGNEFTRQLDHFADRVLGNRIKDVCDFKDGLSTDVLLDRIAADANA